MVNRKIEYGKTLKPLCFYSENDFDMSNLNTGDLVLARVCKVDWHHVILFIDSQIAEIALEEYDIFDEEKNYKVAVSDLGTDILARVKRKEGSRLILERISVINDTIKILSKMVGRVIVATVDKFYQKDLFVDVGNGVDILLHISEMSYAWYGNLHTIFKYGDVLRVKITSYDAALRKFHISRKEAYEPKMFDRGSIIPAMCSRYVNYERTGVIVEYDPGNVGIMDIEEYEREHFRFGEKVYVEVRKYNQVGFQGNYIKKV